MTALYIDRLKNLQKTLLPSQALLLSKPADIAYFSGFETLVPQEREAFLCICAKQAVLFHASFSPVTQMPGLAYKPTTSLPAIQQTITDWKKLGTLVPHPATGSTDLLLDYTSLFVSEFKVLEQTEDVVCNPHNPQKIWQLRMIKDAMEQAALSNAAELSKKTLEFITPHIKPGVTELDLADEIERYIKQYGGKLAFPTIVAFGAHSALPHHQPTSLKLASETAVLLDFGAQMHGYCSDMTRTLWCGEQPSAEFTAAESAVFAAYEAALAVCKTWHTTTVSQEPAPTTIGALDVAARDSLTQAGFGKEFIHTTGHGLGLEIHEQPSIYKTTPTLLQIGMAFTIEPGVYFAGKFGYRYENTILLDQDRVLELTR